MAKMPSSMLPLGTKAPFFSLPDVVSNNLVTLKKENHPIATVIMFICNHCPYVKHVNQAIIELAHDYIKQGICFIAISSNDILSYPDDTPDKMKTTALELGYPFPYLFDETQEVAHAYQAKCTPDFFVFDKHYELVYRGQLDDSRPGNDIEPSGQSIRETLDCMLSNKTVPRDGQKPSLGCGIKWK